MKYGFSQIKPNCCNITHDEYLLWSKGLHPAASILQQWSAIAKEGGGIHHNSPIISKYFDHKLTTRHKYRMIKNTSLQIMLACCLFVTSSQTVLADDYSQNISEDYLRTQFVFKADEKLKYSQCVEKTKYTCTYVWGLESSKDAARVSSGLAPKGDKLQIVYIKAKAEKEFQRVIASYSDALIVDGIGEMAVWSQKRKQLSLITAENLIMHIHIQSQGNDTKEKAVSIARDLLVKL